MIEYETGRKNLEVLQKELQELEISKINEANTRFKFIDRILLSSLGWDHQDLSVEDNYNEKYTDYTFNLFRSVAILEAKKTGIYFELPIGKKDLIRPLKTIIKDNPKIKDAIIQVKGYCSDRSVQIAIISNGWQFLAFIGNRSDSIPVLDGNALVVDSLDCFLKNYKEVWNCLSKIGFQQEYLYKKLLGKSEKELPPKLASTIYRYPGIKDRNPFQTDLEIISEVVLEDVITQDDLEDEFLNDCYCKSGALSSYSLVSREILNTRYDYLFHTDNKKSSLNKVASKKGISPELEDVFANSLSKRPVLLVGDVGVGKSTFIDYLRLVEAPKVFEKALSFKIDLGSKAIIDLNIKKAIVDVIIKQLTDIYSIDIEEDDFVRHCYHVELEKFKSSVKVKRLYDIDVEKAIEKEIEFLTEKVDNKLAHLKSALLYICKSQKKQIITFIDNCDQRSDNDQESAFLVAQEFAKDWPMIVFVSLRPETFHRTKKEKGALSGYLTKAFTIPPPRLDEVIKKRLKFAQRITSGEIPLSILENQTSFSKLDVLLDIFIDSIDTNNDLMTFLNNVSNENVRKAIELITKFFGSGHVDTEKILDIYNDQGYYRVPTHELLRAVIYGENVHYSPSNSEIINVFDVRHHNPNEHFIVLILLALLDDYSKNNRNHGFILISDVYNYLQALGYTTSQIDSVLNFTYSRLMFETSQKGDLLDTDNSELLIRATNVGMYHLRFLINSFTYIDAMIVDTPIFNEEKKAEILNVYTIQERLKRAEIFKNYLDEQWTSSKIDSNVFDWRIYSGQLNEDIERIKSIIQK